MYILILVLLTANGSIAVTTQEFTDQAKCVNAKAQLGAVYATNFTHAVCVAK